MARVISVKDTNATVLLLDSNETKEVDVSMVDAPRGSYVEVFAEQAIGRITKKEAERKRELRLAMMRVPRAAVRA